MLPGKSTSPISLTEKERVLSLIEDVSIDGVLKTPVLYIAQLLIEGFGWPLNSARVRARAVIGRLIRDKTIEAVYHGKRLVSIGLTGKVKYAKNVPQPRLVKQNKVVLPVPEEPAVIRRRPRFNEEKGWARLRRKHELIGERAESRLHKLILKLADILKAGFQELITDISVSRSGHNNPRKGKLNLEDSAGADVTIFLTLRERTGYRKERIIYDAKNSKWSAGEFNDNIRYFPGQEDAILKKAIGTGNTRSDREIVDEILQDMVSVRLLPADCVEKALTAFSDL